uniref:Uncharacterized protein n=1 Tax=Anguilla anguilla TaxID=7936 RepID=A0A0E9T4Z5_ANGAN
MALSQFQNPININNVMENCRFSWLSWSYSFQ